MLPPVCADALLALPTPEQHVQGEAMLIFLRWREELTQQVYARGVPEMRARCVGISAVDRISLGRRWRAKLLYPLRTVDLPRVVPSLWSVVDVSMPLPTGRSGCTTNPASSDPT